MRAEKQTSKTGERTPVEKRAHIPRVIYPSVDGEELFLERAVEFKELTDYTGPQSNDYGIRVYGGFSNAVMQFRGICSLTRNGKPRRLIATASFMDKRELRALIVKLKEIEDTLSD